MVSVDRWHSFTAIGVELSFGLAFPSVCPPSLLSLSAGEIRKGMFFPSGSVACHFHEKQRTLDQSKEKPHVYFMRSGLAGPVKIGYASDVASRLLSLQCGNPETIYLVNVVKNGGEELEKELHYRFRANAIRGEWFLISDEQIEECAKDAV